MSAFMVDREHIDALVHVAVWGPSRTGAPLRGWRHDSLRWWAVPRGTRETLPLAELPRVWREATPETADEVGAMLVAENLASIHYRYPDTRDGSSVPGPLEPYWTEPYVFRRPQRVPTAVEALKLIDCYEYQACEHPEWAPSEAESFCDALRRALIDTLDGYDAAPWGWPR